jgi:hypothetical protein
MADIIKKHLGASRVIVYHHAFRSRGTPRTIDQVNDHHRNPGFLVHSDIDGPGVCQKIKQIFGEEEAAKLMKNRYVVLNVWRPLGSNPITNKPLAIDIEKDIHPLEVRGSTNTSTATTISPNAQNTHQWYYLSNMRSNEMFVFKMYDSKTNVAQTAYHTAFKNTNVPPSDVEQKSLEMRCIVFMITNK